NPLIAILKKRRGLINIRSRLLQKRLGPRAQLELKKARRILHSPSFF
ncbi:MAG: hypothetical protein ACI80W_001962, partial [Porticoccaceae bacterium]